MNQSAEHTDLDDAVIVALGSDLPGAYPSCVDLLEAARERFADHGLAILARSGWWRSAAWPDPSKPPYVNGVVFVRTDLDAKGTHRALQALETAFGRKRGEANAPRTLDLDLIAFGRQVIETPDLTLPHPRAHERLFVMGPLSQVAPGWRHPISGAAADHLAAAATVGRDAKPI
ncbi:2-amino-4-hydroxy-6-hydroxymethyldihydropteridine diphosphokinase [Caulobacter segnis]|uniref:2-amino-4-hydroxy-6- hydroxymethyldihydropteridine diphosphokinase n=1 Tax=Caulobacter segnis TaxID=88688 RepID=UPI00240FA010|nr:2-amino-4-hydroxy-6-hydroxymethyldihydropteridine diphosphokinase [Caulobacter segnis]MDG2521876.1 2-amino-4-hydroxy-6-hydroxymethyldihydropteridine diphosphokinase [Caulobacter segnis]